MSRISIDPRARRTGFLAISCSRAASPHVTRLASLLLAAFGGLPAARAAMPAEPPAAASAALPADAPMRAAQLPAVAVQASRLPAAQPRAAMTVTHATVKQLRPATSDTAQLLAVVPGAAALSAGGVSSLPMIDGLADDRLHIAVDGMRPIAACANHMNPPLSYINPSDVHDIVVYPAVAPVSVGGDSIGATVLVHSAPPQFAEPGQGTIQKGQASTFFRSNGNAKGASLSALFANENLNVTYRGSTVTSDNYTAARSFKPAGLAFPPNASVPGQSIPWLAGNEVGSSAYEEHSQELGMALRRDNHLVELKVGAQHIPAQGFPNQRMDMTENRSTHINLRYTGQYAWGELQGTIYGQNIRHEMNFGPDKQFYYVSGATLASGMPMDTSARNRGARVQASVDLSERDTVRLGTSYQSYTYNEWWPPSGGPMMAPNTFLNINDGHRNRFDLYGEWEARWTPQWASEFGIRSDRVMMNTGTVQGYNAMYNSAPLYPATTFNSATRARTDQNWDWSALARYTPDATRTFSIGYAQKVRSPNLYERYTWSPNHMAMEMIGWFGDGNSYIGNLNLQPETAHTISATANWHAADNESWGLRVMPYYTYVENYIDVQRCPTAVCGSSPAIVRNLTASTGFVDLQFVNQAARIYGLDVSGHLLLATAPRFGRFALSGQLSALRGKNTVTGDNLYDMAPLSGRIALEQKAGNWTNRIEEQLVSAKTQVSHVRNELPTGGYALLNLRSSYAWRNLRLDFGIENALNKFYASPLAGVYLGQGATMPAAGVAWGTPLPGMGRSLYASATIKF